MRGDFSRILIFTHLQLKTPLRVMWLIGANWITWLRWRPNANARGCQQPSPLRARSLANSVLEFDDSGGAGDERGCGGL